MAEFAVGSILVGRYRLESLLGQGGMGSVWRATHLSLNSPVAIKLIDPRIASTELGAERFVREARAAAALRSPHVVQTLDYGVHEGMPYIAMELMEGESLADRLQRVGRLSPAETVRILTHIGRAIGKAHDAGIVHRDLKPDNVFLVHNDDEEIAKVLDFGIAKLTDPTQNTASSSQTQTGTVIGTPYYMSPEQAGGAKNIDSRTDIWAMGVIAYQCLVGDLPFKGDALGELIIRICTGSMPVPSQAAQVPPGFDAWFARACAREPTQRFATARQMTDALRLLLTRGEIAGLEPLSDSAEVSVQAALPPQTNSGITKGSSSLQTSSGTRTAFVVGVLAVLVAGGVAAFALLGSHGGEPTGSTPSTTVATQPAKVDTPPPTRAVEKTAPAETARPGEPSVSPAMTAQVKPGSDKPDAGRNAATAGQPRPGRPHAARPTPAPGPAKPSRPGAPPAEGHTDFGF